AFEIIDQLGGVAPDILAIPVGNAGNISAYWKGFKEHNEKKQTNLPKIYGFEAELSAAITKNKIINEPETIATAIRIGNPASWNLATTAHDESHPIIDSVSNDYISSAYIILPAKESLSAEPGS